tara:strand:- start:1187 stop:1642 length:456 start_codon:yes stop_codon:yes gene_type:complete
MAFSLVKAYFRALSSRALAIMVFWLSLATQCYCLSLEQRAISVINDTDINFSMQPYPFGNADFSAFSYDLQQYSRVDFHLNSADLIQPANGIVVFMMSGRYVFSLVMKDQSISVHGCKSKNVFYHPAEYVCVLKSEDTGVNTLHIMRPIDV